MRTPVILVAGQKNTDPVVGALLRSRGTLVVEHRFDGHVVGRTMASLQHGVLTTAATGLELSVITAVVLGGATLSGGEGSVLGTLVGLLIVGVLNDGLILKNVSPFWQQVAQGALLIAAVSFDRLSARFIAQ